MKITKEQILKMERTARREADIEVGYKGCSHKVHTSKKTYNRKNSKIKKNSNLDDLSFLRFN